MTVVPRFLDSTTAQRPHATQIKVCGITRIEDALQIAHYDINAVGLVFYSPSPRHLSSEQAKLIKACLPTHIASVAVVVNPDDELLVEITQQIEPDYIQFHGDETESRCLEPGIPYIKALRVQSSQQVQTANECYPTAAGLLLDAYVKDQVGGTGKTFSWRHVPKIDQPIILAGGLHYENIVQAVTAVKPAAVDVSTGVETRAGIKDIAAVRRFVAAVRKADELEYAHVSGWVE